jgi:hypothetical protein
LEDILDVGVRDFEKHSCSVVSKVYSLYISDKARKKGGKGGKRKHRKEGLIIPALPKKWRSWKSWILALGID